MDGFLAWELWFAEVLGLFYVTSVFLFEFNFVKCVGFLSGIFYGFHIFTTFYGEY